MLHFSRFEFRIVRTKHYSTTLLFIHLPSLIHIDLKKLLLVFLDSMERVDREMAVGYFPTHMRTSSYLVGITAGYILHRIKTGKWSENLVTSFTVYLILSYLQNNREFAGV